MQLVGHVKQIWRYPVKGMAGETRHSLAVDQHGVRGDRLWAVRDVARQEIQSCKFRPALLRCIATLIDSHKNDATMIQFPDGRQFHLDDVTLNDALSDLLGHASTLEALRPLSDTHFYKRYKADGHDWQAELEATFDRTPGEPLPAIDFSDADTAEYVSSPGTFFLVAPLHLLTTASLDFMHQQQPNADWDIARFRPNILIETLPALSGLVEQQWQHKTLKINTLTVYGAGTTPRCGVVTQPQQQLSKNTDVLRTIVKQADQNLGIYSTVHQAGHIQLGDAVYLLD